MRIAFEMSGGYGGLFALNPLLYRVDTDELPDEECERLVHLVHASGVLTMPPTKTDTDAGGQPDVYTYKLSITDGGVAVAFSFDDTTACTAVRPLVRYLQERAVERRMKDG